MRAWRLALCGVWTLLLLSSATTAAAASGGPTLDLSIGSTSAYPNERISFVVQVWNPTSRATEWAIEIDSDVPARIEPSSTLRAGPEDHGHARVFAELPNATNVTHVITVRLTEVGGEGTLEGRADFDVGWGRASDLQWGRYRVDLMPWSVFGKPGETHRVVLHVWNVENETLPLQPRFGDLGGAMTIETGDHVSELAADEWTAIPLTIRLDANVTSTTHREVHTTFDGVGFVDTFPGLSVIVIVTPTWFYAAVFAAFVAAVGIPTVLYLTRRSWMFAAAALYTRLSPSSLLDQPLRQAILAAVKESPGIAYNELARRVSISRGQIAHHTRVLERGGVIFSVPDGQTRRFFAIEAGRPVPVPPLADRLLASVHQGSRRASDIARELGVSRQALHYHVKHLVAQGKLVARSEGRETWLEAAPQEGSRAGEGLARS